MRNIILKRKIIFILCKLYHAELSSIWCNDLRGHPVPYRLSRLISTMQPDSQSVLATGWESRYILGLNR